jgi:hypothetical protein
MNGRQIMETYLKKNHTEANTLYGIQNSQPQPKGYAEIRTCLTRPGDI